MSRIGCMPEPSFTRLGTTLRAPWGSVRLASDAERPGAGAPAGLQNRSAGVTRRWVGSIPAPLRFTGKTLRAGSLREVEEYESERCHTAEDRCIPAEAVTTFPTFSPQDIRWVVVELRIRLLKIGVEEDSSFVFRSREELSVAIQRDGD